MKRWIEPDNIIPSPRLTAALDVHPLVAQTLTRRGLTDPIAARAFLDPDAYTPASPFDLPDMERTAARIERAIARGEYICIWGDFDVDGQTSTALLVDALRSLGADVTYHIPQRGDGHGVHIPGLETIINAGARLIITCDTGIAAHDAVDFVNSRNVDIIITDHHQLPDTLPDAYANVNPQRLPADHPLHPLPGVGCAYKVIEAVYMRAAREDELTRFLDLVALGIVADVAQLTGDARYLLQRGLAQLRHTERLGLQILMDKAGINPERINEGNIGFGIGPRLNALGRLDDANAAVELLTTSDNERAQILVDRLEGLNSQRQMLTSQVLKAAQEQINAAPELLDSAVLVLNHPAWPGGIVGIVANKLVEQYNRPVFLLTSPPGEIARGSARGVTGLDLTAAIAAHADLLEGYGGHEMAAGISIQPENIDAFRRAISKTVASTRQEIDLTPILNIDANVPLSALSLDFVDEINHLAPFGPGNPPLTLAAYRLTQKSYRQLGRTDAHLKLTVEDESGGLHEVFWWNADLDALPPGRFDLAYIPRSNEYKGERELQIELIDIRPVDEEPLEFSQRARIDIEDHRAASDPLAILHTLLPHDDTIIWAEAAHKNELDGYNARPRHELTHTGTLIIWTTPPGPDELHAALDAVNPARIYLFGVNPGTDSVQAFLGYLGGLVKHVINNLNGQTSLQHLAAASAQRESVIRAGLDWFAARGQVHITENDGGELRITTAEKTGEQPDNAQKAASTAHLAQMLSEIAAYRGHFRSTDPQRLLGR